MSILCPDCGSHTSVIDSRSSSDGLAVRRRRKCLKKKCGERFTILEAITPEGSKLPSLLLEQQRAFKLLDMIRKLINSREV